MQDYNCTGLSLCLVVVRPLHTCRLYCSYIYVTPKPLNPFLKSILFAESVVIEEVNSLINVLKGNPDVYFLFYISSRDGSMVVHHAHYTKSDYRILKWRLCGGGGTTAMV